MSFFDGIKVVVFDFDGTLVHSNELKREAFFKIFSSNTECVAIVDSVLSESNALSRYEIIECILRKLGRQGDILEEQKSLVESYGNIVLSAVKKCPEIMGATELLKKLQGRYTLYLSSMTPEVALKEIVYFRGLTKYFDDIYGYPRKKEETLRLISRQKGIISKQLLVVGDGESDIIAAEIVGCPNIMINSKVKLKDLIGLC